MQDLFMKEVLKSRGLSIANRLFEKTVVKLDLLNQFYGDGNLKIWIEKDKQGLTQPSSNFGPIRQIILAEALREEGIMCELFGDKLDLLITLDGEHFYDMEIKGSFSSNSTYNSPRGGKLSITHKDPKFYFIILTKLAINDPKVELVSLNCLLLHMNSYGFEHTKSDKVNISLLSLSKLRKINPEYIVGEWEIFNDGTKKTNYTI